MADKAIKAIYGFEPQREGEYPVCYIVGSPWTGGGGIVTEITYYEHNYGDHGLGWFRIAVDGTTVAEMAARAVAEIHYMP